jgi:branched-chain amino acid transport system substrate-binding protein
MREISPPHCDESRRNISPRAIRKALTILIFISVTAALIQSSVGGVERSRESGTIKIGIFVPLTGNLSDFGQSTLDGLRFAADKTNRAGGIGGREFELIVEDTKSDAAESAAVVHKLITQDQVDALIGGVASSHSLAAAPIAQSSQVPMITHASTHPSITQKGDYIFRVCFTDKTQGEALAIFAANTLRAKRAAIMIDASADYSMYLADVFGRSFLTLGGRVVTRQRYSSGDQDFMSQLTAIKRAKPDVIFIPGYYDEAGLIARQAKQIGITATLVGGDGWDSPQLLQIGESAMNNSFFSNQFVADDPFPVSRSFTAQYEEHFKRRPDMFSALGYDAMNLVSDAARRAAGTVSRQKLRDEIALTRNFVGVTGVISMNPERSPQKQVIVIQVKDNTFAYKETVIISAEPPQRRSHKLRRARRGG